MGQLERVQQVVWWGPAGAGPLPRPGGGGRRPPVHRRQQGAAVLRPGALPCIQGEDNNNYNNNNNNNNINNNQADHHHTRPGARVPRDVPRVRQPLRHGGARLPAVRCRGGRAAADLWRGRGLPLLLLAEGGG